MLQNVLHNSQFGRKEMTLPTYKLLRARANGDSCTSNEAAEVSGMQSQGRG